MYRKIYYPPLFAMLLLLGCGNSNTAKNSEETKTQKTATPTGNNNAGEQVQLGEGIIGDWKLALETSDDNENKLLDEEERKKAFPNHYFYRFNTDGSCLINFTGTSRGAFKGHYEKKKVGTREKLLVYLDEGDSPGLNDQQYIVSVTKDELVLLNAANEITFWIFKRP